MARKNKDTAENTPAVETAEATAVEQTEESNAETTVIYAGASLPGVRSSTVFKGALPEILKREYISELCVPIERFPEFLKRKNVTSSREALCYRKSVQLAAELAKEV